MIGDGCNKKIAAKANVSLLKRSKGSVPKSALNQASRGDMCMRKRI